MRIAPANGIAIGVPPNGTQLVGLIAGALERYTRPSKPFLPDHNTNVLSAVKLCWHLVVASTRSTFTLDEAYIKHPESADSNWTEVEVWGEA
jgi:hypothetical protein